MSTPYHSKALPEGTILREWQLEQVLGVGGFGIVYRGKGVYFDETVAIKEYFPGAISDRQDGATVTPTDSSSVEIYDLGLQKFVEEAKVLWNLSKPERHPNIVSVRSLFEIHGTAYMVMDFESGVSLSEALRSGRRFDEAGLLELIRPIAEGLDRAHRAGVLHRDIKPANILVDETGRPVLIDFGSARFDSGQATSTKVTFYTPPYAAIEQYVKTYPQGPWTDIYALGVTLYQCVTGEKPPEVLERLHGGLGEALSARERPGFSRAFTRAVDAAMAIRPTERPQSIPEWLKLFDAPEAAIDDEATRVVVRAPPPPADPPVAQPPAPQPPAPVIAPVAAPVAAPKAPPADPGAADPVRRRSPLVILGLVAVVVALVGGAAVLMLSPSHPAGGAQPAAAAAPAAASPPSSPAASPLIEQNAAALVAAAQKIGRPPSEIAALVAAKAKITDLAGQIRGLAAAPDAAAKTAPLVADLNRLAADMARHEAALLGRAAEGQALEVEHTLARASAGGGAVAQVRQAKTALDAAVAAVSQTDDGAQALAAAGQAVSAFGGFSGAYADATRFFAPAKRAELAALVASARATSAQVVALAAGPKPWLFASQDRKQAYQLLLSDGARSKADAAQLDQLSRTAAATSDLRSLDAGLAQASAIKRDLAGLLASANAAARSGVKPS